MAYVKRKRIKGRDYYYLAQSYREGGKVKTKTLRYLGTEKPVNYQITSKYPASLSPKVNRVSKIEQETIEAIQRAFGGAVRFISPEEARRIRPYTAPRGSPINSFG